MINKLNKNGFNVNYTYPNLLYISWQHVPSEINRKIKEKLNLNSSDKNNKIDNNTNNNTLNYRYIDDYKHSKNFMNKLNNNRSNTININ